VVIRGIDLISDALPFGRQSWKKNSSGRTVIAGTLLR
jgi:hypothetical protein